MIEYTSGMTLSHRIDTRPTASTFIALILLPLCIPVYYTYTESWCYENGILENLQIIILALSIIFCLTGKREKPLLQFAALMLLFIMLREVNCGRVLFWSKSGEMFYSGPIEEYLKWREIPHGKTIRLIIYAVMGVVAAIALFTRSTYKYILKVIRTERIQLWECVMLFAYIIIAKLADAYYHSLIVEELAECLMYCTVAALVYRFSRTPTHTQA